MTDDDLLVVLGLLGDEVPVDAIARELEGSFLGPPRRTSPVLHFFVGFQSGTFSTRVSPSRGGNHGQQGQGRFEELEDRGEQVAEGEAPGEEGESHSCWRSFDGNVDEQVVRAVSDGEECWTALSRCLRPFEDGFGQETV